MRCVRPVGMSVTALLACATMAQDDPDRRLTLTVHVTDALTGRDVEGVSLALTELTPPKGVTAVQEELSTNKQGVANFTKLRPGRYGLVVLSVPDGKFAIEELPTVLLERNTRQEIKLPPPASISGTVRMSDGSKFPNGLFVSAIQKNPPNQIYKTVKPDESGNWRIDGLNAQIGVFVWGGAKGIHMKIIPDEIRLKPFAETEKICIILDPVNKSIVSLKGYVRLNGNPAPDQPLVLTSHGPIDGFIVREEITTDEGGSFTVHDLPAGDYRIILGVDVAAKGSPPNFPHKDVRIETGKITQVLFDEKTE